MVGTDKLQLAVDWNVGTYVDPAHGPDHYGNNNFSLSDWLGGAVPPNQGFTLSQPQLLHDQQGDPHGFDRYLLVATANSWKTQQSRLALAVNKYLGPVDYGTPCTFSFDANYLPNSPPTRYYVDEPRLGMSRKAVIITANLYAFADNSFQYAKIWVLPKSRLYDQPNEGTCPTSDVVSKYVWNLKNADGTTAFSVVPAKSYQTGAVDYLVNAYNEGPEGANQLTVWKMNTTKPVTSLVRYTLTTNPYVSPPNAQQAGTRTLITTWGTRLFNAVYGKSGVWTAHTTGCIPAGDTTARACVQWFNFDPVARRMKQEGYLGVPNADFYGPEITADPAGDAVLAFNGSASYAAVGVYYAGRQHTDPRNTFQPFLLLKDGEGCYERSPANTVGMHSAVDQDATDPQKFWLAGAYTTGKNGNCQANDWAIAVGEVTFPEPAVAGE
jgi:hypothetical protein